MAKEKMSIEKKTKLMYSAEIAFFAIVFFVLATLEVLNIIGKRTIMLDIFNFVTCAGGVWMIVDFFWVLFSKKRRKKNSLLDKALLVPLGIYLITFDIICFCKMPIDKLDDATNNFRRLMMGIALYYAGAIYIFQAIYHYFYPVPMLIKAIDDIKKAEEEERLKEQQAQSEVKTSSENDDVVAETDKQEEKDLQDSRGF